MIFRMGIYTTTQLSFRNSQVAHHTLYISNHTSIFKNTPPILLLSEESKMKLMTYLLEHGVEELDY